MTSLPRLSKEDIIVHHPGLGRVRFVDRVFELESRWRCDWVDAKTGDIVFIPFEGVDRGHVNRLALVEEFIRESIKVFTKINEE